MQIEHFCKSFYDLSIEQSSNIRSAKKAGGSHQVLHGVDMRLERGRLIGFLGPNGAGKTTTIRILMGLLSASSGSATIFGKPVDSLGKSIRREIGYLPGDVHLYSNMKAISFLGFLAAARRRDCLAEARRVADVLDPDLTKKIRSYSTGMRQKLGLIQALMHLPQLLILDEPTSSLDPLVRQSVFKELRAVTQSGRTVLFSSHSLDEVELLCDEVVILREGRIVEHQQIAVLKGKGLWKIRIVLAANCDRLPDFPAGLTVTSIEGKTIAGTWAGVSNELLHWLSGLDIADVLIERPDLNDLFISYYTGQTRSALV